MNADSNCLETIPMNSRVLSLCSWLCRPRKYINWKLISSQELEDGTIIAEFESPISNSTSMYHLKAMSNSQLDKLEFSII